MKIEVINLLTYFLVYSFLGWMLESIFKTILEKKPVNSGFLHGPFCPIYGIGALIMYLCLSKIKTNVFLVFIIGFIVLSLWEYFVGWALEKIFHTTYWDYSNNKFNIKGRVCLLNSIFWGVLSVIFIFIIHPFVAEQIAKVPQSIIVYFLILIYTYIIIDTIISVVKVKNITNKLEKIKEIGNTIKEKIEHLEMLKKSTDLKENTIVTLQNVIDDLKLKQNRLKRKLYRHTYRLKKAFPTMKSETITEILNQKIDKIKNKNKQKRS